MTAKMAALGLAVPALLWLCLGLGSGRAMAAVPLVIWHGMGEPRGCGRRYVAR